jgi:glycine cleavage system H lipoate-binding protein
MKKKAARGGQLTWQEAMRRRPGLERVCRHTLTRRIASRQCAADYACERCEFDQFFEDVWGMRARTRPREVRRVRGFDVPMDHYYHKGHTWARVESGGYIRIGMDDFALKVLGEADSLDLPLLGKELNQGSPGWGLKRKGNPADVLSPVDGVVVEVNAGLNEGPSLANRGPYGEGWFFAVRTPNVKGAMENLMEDTEGLEWMKREVDVLEGMIETVVGPLAADGGFLTDDIYGALPELGWKNLTGTFLRSRG